MYSSPASEDLALLHIDPQHDVDLSRRPFIQRINLSKELPNGRHSET